MGETRELLAPDLLLPEFGNILWKKIRLGQVSLEQGRQILKDFQALPLQIYASAPLMSPTFNIANSLKRSVYDSSYLALAVTNHCQMVTADQKLYNAIRSSSLAAHLCWLEDVLETDRQQE